MVPDGLCLYLFISFVPTVQHVAHIWWCPLVSTKTKLESKTNFLFLRILLQLGKTPAILPSKNQHLETQWWLTVPIAKGKNLRLQSFSRSREACRPRYTLGELPLLSLPQLHAVRCAKVSCGCCAVEFDPTLGLLHQHRSGLAVLQLKDDVGQQQIEKNKMSSIVHRVILQRFSRFSQQKKETSCHWKILEAVPKLRNPRF